MHAASKHLGSPCSSCHSIEGLSGAKDGSPASLSQKMKFETIQSDCNQYRNIKIAFVISHVVFIIVIFILILCLVYFQGRSVPSNHQKDEIKCPLVTCPPDWIAHQGHCYNLSREEKNWVDSRNACILHNASLAKIIDEEMDFVTMLIRDHVFWIGLRREPDQPWKWLDGENAKLKVMGKGSDCAFLNDDATASSGRCTTEHRYICKKI